MPHLLTRALATTSEMEAAFSDASVLQAMLDFESALARAEARAGVIPAAAASAITEAAATAEFDTELLARQALRAGTLAIPLVRMLIARVHESDPSSSAYVHWGATSQDVTDTALVLLLKCCRGVLAADHTRLDQALLRLSETHANSVMLARTLLQPAPPTTFGLKAAGWLGSIRRSWLRLQQAFDDALILQFGGASGTLAAFGEQGIAVSALLAEELDLAVAAPWQAHRDRLAFLAAACAIYTGSLGKMARDVALLSQSEVGEAAESGGEGRGGSSTMPHKRNPIACSLALAAANRVPGHVAAFLAGMVQEQERAAGGWQAEWTTLTSILCATGLALASMAEAAEGLTVDTGRMRANLRATGGVIFSERALLLLAAHTGRERAHRLVENAVAQASAAGPTLAQVLATMPEVTEFLTPAQLASLETPEDYLGSAQQFRRRLLAGE
jgi:3-carboxy-cis,cis-muconate cycloisomerase